MEPIKNTFGQHFLVEFLQCNAETLKNVETVKLNLLKSAQESNATIVSHHFHQFQPDGVSGVILIEESHFSIHTWPEHQYAAFDVFTCGPMDPNIAIDVLKQAFEAKTVNIKTIARGF